MDDLLTMYTEERLLSELEKGHYWFFNGKFYSNSEKFRKRRPVSVENAAYFRFYA